MVPLGTISSIIPLSTAMNKPALVGNWHYKPEANDAMRIKISADKSNQCKECAPFGIVPPLSDSLTGTTRTIKASTGTPKRD